MHNPTNSLSDEERLRAVMQKLAKCQTDINRLRLRVPQMIDSIGVPVTGLTVPVEAYTPDMGP